MFIPMKLAIWYFNIEKSKDILKYFINRNIVALITCQLQLGADQTKNLEQVWFNQGYPGLSKHDCKTGIEVNTKLPQRFCKIYTFKVVLELRLLFRSASLQSHETCGKMSGPKVEQVS